MSPNLFLTNSSLSLSTGGATFQFAINLKPLDEAVRRQHTTIEIAFIVSSLIAAKDQTPVSIRIKVTMLTAKDLGYRCSGFASDYRNIVSFGKIGSWFDKEPGGRAVLQFDTYVCMYCMYVQLRYISNVRTKLKLRLSHGFSN